MAGPFKASEAQIDDIRVQNAIQDTLEWWKNKHPEAEIFSIAPYVFNHTYLRLCIVYREPDVSRPPYRG